MSDWKGPVPNSVREFVSESIVDERLNPCVDGLRALQELEVYIQDSSRSLEDLETRLAELIERERNHPEATIVLRNVMSQLNKFRGPIEVGLHQRIEIPPGCVLFETIHASGKREVQVHHLTSEDYDNGLDVTGFI